MPRIYEMKGKVFGRLTVIDRAVHEDRNASWNCQCTCGNTVRVLGYSLRRGDTKSCGCFHRELSRKKNKARTIRRSRYNALDKCDPDIL